VLDLSVTSEERLGMAMLQEQWTVAGILYSVFSFVGKPPCAIGGPCTRGSPGAGGRLFGVISRRVWIVA
jgi:hypothetical protein